jgi:ABC-type multidrug transport system fused ATPase/permease subunit
MTNQHGSRRIPDFNKKAWRFYRATFAGSYSGLLLTTLASAGQMLLIIPSLLLVKYAFDELIPAKNITYLLITGVIILLLRVLNSLISLAVRRKHIQIINKAIFRLRDTILTRLYSFSRSFYLKNDHRLIHIRIVEDTERLANMSTALISRLFPSVLISIGLLVVLMILNGYLLLIIIALFPLLFFANRFVGMKIKHRVFVFQRAFEHFSKGIFFVLRFMSLTQVQSAQQIEIQRQRRILEDLKEKTGSLAMI